MIQLCSTPFTCPPPHSGEKQAQSCQISTFKEKLDIWDFDENFSDF